MASYDVSGKVVFVTGGARGIGAETARRLVGRGAKVALVGLEPELLEQRAQELGTGNVVWFEADVTDEAQLQAAVDGTVEALGGIDVTIANAGIASATPFGATELDIFDAIVAVNLGGVFRTMQATMPHVTARSGYVLPVASLATAMHAPMMAAYSATKAGVEALANCMRTEVAHTGTKVGCAYFGFIDTDMVRKGFESESGRKAADRMRFGGPNQSVPVGAAGAAIVRAIERRARMAYAPRWIIGPLLLRTLIQPLQEQAIVRQGVADVLDASAHEEHTLTTPQPHQHHL